MKERRDAGDRACIVTTACLAHLRPFGERRSAHVRPNVLGFVLDEGIASSTEVCQKGGRTALGAAKRCVFPQRAGALGPDRKLGLTAPFSRRGPLPRTTESEF